jgi:hypothetical protein
VKALSIRQPWAELIAKGCKSIEVRSWTTNYRGPLLICEAQGGGAVALVDLVLCEPFTKEHDVDSCGAWTLCEQFRSRYYAWRFSLLSRASSSVIKGKLGLFDVDDSIVTLKTD